jgi:adhesin/invasin
VTFHSSKSNSVRVCAFLVFFGCARLAMAQQITTIAGDGVLGYAGDNGPAIQAQIAAQGVAVDRWDNIYLAEPTNHVVRRIDHKTGIITTFAGTGQQGARI